jgi:16S rRNA (guanine527-N7)-methyltransferase
VEQLNHCCSLLERCSEQIGVHLQADQLKQFMVYLEQLQVWNQSINLTSITSAKEIVVKHFVDSLAALTAEPIKQGSNLLDIGTGAGFPGIPLKIARQDLQITLIEPVQKKVSFLYSVVGLLHLENADVFCGTLDQFMAKSDPDRLFDYVTTRALRHDVILQEGSRLLTAQGRAIIYSSHPINQFKKGWSLVAEHGFDLPLGFGHRVISILFPSKRLTV